MNSSREAAETEMGNESNWIEMKWFLQRFEFWIDQQDGKQNET